MYFIRYFFCCVMDSCVLFQSPVRNNFNRAPIFVCVSSISLSNKTLIFNWLLVVGEKYLNNISCGISLYFLVFFWLPRSRNYAGINIYVWSSGCISFNYYRYLYLICCILLVNTELLYIPFNVPMVLPVGYYPLLTNSPYILKCMFALLLYPIKLCMINFIGISYLKEWICLIC